MTIAESLKKFRKEFRLSQKDVATAIGMSQQSYQAYDVSTDYLLGRSETPHPTNFDEREVKEAFAFRDAWQEAMQKLPQPPAQ